MSQAIAEAPLTITEVNITPHGYSVPGGAARIAAAHRAFEVHTAEVANLATDLLKTHDGELGWLVDGDENEDLRADLVELHDAITFRNEAQEEMLRAIAGAPAAPKGGA